MYGIIFDSILTLQHFTQVPKTCSAAALQVGFLKHLGDVTTVLLDLVCLGLLCFFRSLCGALAVVRLLVQTKISLDYYN